jgi:two-component system, NtrC family, response regulator
VARVVVLQVQSSSSSILTEMLEKLRHKILEVQTAERAITKVSAGDIDIIFIDQQVSDSAVSTLSLLKNEKCIGGTPVIVVTSSAKTNDIIETMRLGAFDHLSKPVSIGDLESVINRALTRPSPDLVSSSPQELIDEFLVGSSPVMRQVEKLIGMAAACDATVLVQGETGTGKGTVARVIHKHSQHRQESLTVIDCTAVPEDYGSFASLTPGAQGTVILDEIGDLNAQMQAMLVRVLKEAPLTVPSGLPTKVRVIATTQYDLINMVKEKRFREDLYYRLNVLPLLLPPLRQRGSDILALAETFLQQACPDAPKRVSSSAAKFLLDYQWPGNVRELQNLMYHLTVAVRSRVIEEGDLSRIFSKAEQKADKEETLDYYSTMASLEKRLLASALEKANGSRAEAARLLGINRQLLYAKLRAHGLMGK